VHSVYSGNLKVVQEQFMEQSKQTLIIVESPTKAKTISRFLPKQYKVIASKGHIRDLGEKEMGIDVDHGYACKYHIVEGKAPLIAELKKELGKSDKLLLATDEDREGESISWHLVQVLKPSVPYQRMVFHEITKTAIQKALQTGRGIDEDLVQAQEGRRVVDRLYGYSISPILWKKLANKKLSAGRVQSVGLRLTVDREKERILFLRSVYFDALATLRSAKGDQYQARLVSVDGKTLAQSKDFDGITGVYKGKENTILCDKDMVDSFIQRLEGKSWMVTSIQKKPFVTRPNVPFTTSTLQQDAIKKFHWSSSLVMSVAQLLYENGFITYMRTDSPTLSGEGTRAARESVEVLYGKTYLSPEERHFTAHTAGAQEAHEAIRPAGDHFRTPEETGLVGRERMLYDLIWKRTLACQMADARKSTTTVNVACDGALFVASGTEIVFPGFIRAYVEGNEDPDAALSEKETLLPSLVEGETETLLELSDEEHQTKAPARYTEASLVQELEKRGIGRPSTYATIIKTLLDRAYVTKEGSALVPTFMGFAVCQYLEQHFAQFVDYDFTSKMESDLDEIAEGKERKLDFLDAFYRGPTGLLAQDKEQMEKQDNMEARTLHLPQISDDNPIKVGPYGCYVQKNRGDGNKPESIPIPSDWIPGAITDAMVKELLSKGKQSTKRQPVELDDGIQLMDGKFGLYWQKGEKKASVPSWANDEQARDSQFAERYLSLPRVLGMNEKGEEVYATVGKYGPYVGCNGTYRNLNKTDKDVQLFAITLEEALSLLSQEKTPSRASFRMKRTAQAGSLRTKTVEAIFTYGQFEGRNVDLANGKYGFYVRHDGMNYSLPYACKKDEAKAKGLSLDNVIEIIKDKRQKDTT